MKLIYSILAWIFTVMFSIIALSMAANGNWFRTLIILIIIFLILPPIKNLKTRLLARYNTWLIHLVSFIVLLAIVWLSGNMNQPDSIYLSTEYKTQLMDLYEARMKEWPVPYETKSIYTRLGRVHVIIGGPKDAPPALLCHAGALPSWSWKYNIKEFNQHFRTYAIDAIGEAGKSVLHDINKHTTCGEDIAELYSEISDSLGIDQAFVIGASYGGFIGANYAIYARERVKKLVLLAAMGVTPATGSTLSRIILLSIFPIKPVQDSFIKWMIAGSGQETKEIVEWMRIVFDGVRAKETPPLTFSQEQLKSVKVPVLLILGNKDNLVGDPEKVIDYTKIIPDIQTEIVDASHALWAQQPEKVNELIYKFCIWQQEEVKW